MQIIEKTDYGFRITNSGLLTLPEAESFKFKLLEKLSGHQSSFSLLVDIRGLIPLEPEVAEVIKEIMRTCAQMSIIRAAIVVSSPVIKAQQQQMSYDSLTAQFDRTIDASKYLDWEERALAWVKEGTEPVPLEVE
jgi:hypothetical protein